MRVSRRRFPADRSVTTIALLILLFGSAGRATPASSAAVDGGGSRDIDAVNAVASQPRKQTPAATAAFDPRTFYLRLTLVQSGFTSPVLVTSPRDGSNRLFVVEQSGRIKIIKNGSTLSTPFLDIRSKVTFADERGLLGLAFHPNFATHPFVYVNYVDLNGNTVIRRYTVSSNPDVADPNSGLHILAMGQPYSNHKGGNLAFGPDGFLYIGMGDGGSTGDPGNRAQNISSPLGKMLRIDVDHTSGTRNYRSPSTNPYVGRTGLDEIWARGLRNPWRWSFDRATGALWIADVGQDRYEEINRSLKSGSTPAGRGANYGWPTLEGRACYRPSSGCSTSGKVAPLIVYPHVMSGPDNCSVTGGFVYRGSDYPVMAGGYLFGDFCSGRMWMMPSTGSSPDAVQVYSTGAVPAINPSSFGEDDDGELYVCDLSGGGVYKISAVLR